MSRWEGFEELVQVVKSGSFSAAARTLGVSKGHVSQQVSRLEDRLGARLLHRTTRKLSLTELGSYYYQRCSQIVEELDEVEQAVGDFQQRATGLLKISSPNLLGEAHLVPAIAKFLQLHPALDIELNFYSRKVDLVEDGYDLAIQVGKRTDINVVNKVLAHTKFHVVGSAHFLNENGAPGKPQDLKSIRCLNFTEYGSFKPWKFTGPKGEIKVSGLDYWRSNSGHALLAAAREGIGLAYLPDYYLTDDVKSGRLIPVLEDWSTDARDIVAIYQHKRHLSAKVSLFVGFLEDHFSAWKPW